RYRPLLLFPSQLREHRQRHNLRRGSLRDREVSDLIPEPRIRLLQMQRYRVVDPRPDAYLRQMPHEAIPVRNTDYVQVIHRLRPAGLEGHQPSHARLGEQLTISDSGFPPARTPLRETLQLHRQYARLNRRQPTR